MEKSEEYWVFIGIFLAVVGLYYPIIFGALSGSSGFLITIEAFAITLILSIILMAVMGFHTNVYL